MFKIHHSRLAGSILATAILTAALAGTVSVTATTQASALPKICKTEVQTGSGRWKSKIKAAAAARAKWRYVVARKVGKSWAIWSLANVTNKTCSKKWFGWQCRYQAKPCRLSADAPKSCKTKVQTGSGRWKSKSKAATAARAKWRYVVAKNVGGSWARWSLAEVTSKKCTKEWYGWKCRYQAKPCRLN